MGNHSANQTSHGIHPHETQPTGAAQFGLNLERTPKAQICGSPDPYFDTSAIGFASGSAKLV